MVKKGIVSSIDSELKRARILLPETNTVTPAIPYTVGLAVHDTVLVAFTNPSMTDGAIFGNLTNDSDEDDSTPYTHNQIVPSDEWVISHNLGKHPAIAIVDSSGALVHGDIQYNNTDVVTITFNGAFAGKAYLN